MFQLRAVRPAPSTLAIVALAPLALALAGCASADSSQGETPSTADQGQAVSSGATGECVMSTLFFDDGMVADLEGAVGPTFISHPGGNYYDHVVIPHALDAVIGPIDFGNGIDTLNGFDIDQEVLAPGSTAKPRTVAHLDAAPPSDAKLTFLTKKYAVSKAIFDALTQATETTEHHVAPQASYDRSFDQVKRASAHGRVVCTSTTYPGSGESRPTYACHFFGLSHTMTQSFDASQAGGFCPTR